MLVALGDAGKAHGGKAAGLGRLVRAGFTVPEGLVIPADVPERDVVAALPSWVGTTEVAVRSSATNEDGVSVSAAGIYDTILGVVGIAEVVAAVGACRRSVWSARAVAHRKTHHAELNPGMAVIVQRQVPADTAGVLLTAEDRVIIEATRGSGADVVAGRVTPDRYVVPTPDDTTSTAGCLDRTTVRRLAAVGRKVERLLGHHVDVEWALADDELWLLQARPVTAPLIGTGGSAGVATGPARLVEGPQDFGRVRPGDVLVCRHTDPAWTPLLGVVAAVVTEVGGLLSHAAILAREQGVPAVLGLAGALVDISDGQVLTVDGTAGTVRRPGVGHARR